MNLMKRLRLMLVVLLLTGMCSFIPKALLAQQQPAYTMECVRAVQLQSAGRNHILAVFKVTPAIKDFKLILSMKVTYEIGHGERIVDLQRQKEGHIRITVYGSSIAEKNEKLYALIKDKIRLDTKEDIRLLMFDFYDITTEAVDKMSITYGLWESGAPDVRHESRYDFAVEQL